MNSIEDMIELKDLYINYLKKKDGCLIMVDKFIFKNNVDIVGLELIGLDCYGEPLHINIDIDVIKKINLWY